MKRSIAASLVVAALVPEAAHAQLPAYHGNAQHTGFREVNGPQDPQLRWKLDLQGAIVSSPVIGPDGTVYLGSVLRDVRHPEHFITAVRPDGTVKWRFPTGWWDAQTQSSPALGPDGRVYVGAQDGRFYALNADGTLAWSFAGSSPVQQHPVVAPDGTIYVGIDGKLHAFTPAGAVKWTADLGYALPGGPALAPDGGTIYAFGYTTAGPTATLYAFRPDGSLKWRFDSFYAYYPALSAPTVAADGTVLVLSGHIVAISPAGVERWRYSPSAAYYSNYGSLSVTPGGDVVFAFSWYLGKLRLADGEPAWQVEFLGGEYLSELESTYSAPAIDADGSIFLGLGTGKRWTRDWGKVVRSYDAGGELEWEFPLGEGVYTSSPALAADGTLYVGSMDGFLYALQDAGATPPNAITSLDLDPPSVGGGTPGAGMVTLRWPAPAGGATVTLASETNVGLRLPPTALVAPGASTATFTFGTGHVNVPATVRVCGTYGGATACDTITVMPQGPGARRRPRP
jgi:outer membrane protein assembly factor BamB